LEKKPGRKGKEEKFLNKESYGETFYCSTPKKITVVFLMNLKMPPW
jgi:hypothetical protein